jgi:hypothetical protein
MAVLIIETAPDGATPPRCPGLHAPYCLKLQAVLELRIGEPLTEDEVTYLTLHVARLVDEDRSQAS